MYALKLTFIYTALIIVTSLRFNEAVAAGRSRRRFGPAKIKVPANEATEKSAADQTALTSTNTEPNKYHRREAYSTEADDYLYNTADINLVQPENTKIRTKYTSSITIPYNALEDTETAEEYVAKAVGMYSARFREPIRVSYEPEHIAVEEKFYEQQPRKKQESFHQSKPLLQKESEEQRDLPQKVTEEPKQTYNEYYNYNQKEVTQPTYAQEKLPNHKQVFYQYSPRPTNENAVATNSQALQNAHDQERQQQERSQPAGHNAHELNAGPYEKEPVTRSYQIYEEQTEAYEPAQQLLAERNYHTKFIYKPNAQYQENASENQNDNANANANENVNANANANANENERANANENENAGENEQRIRVSSSTEIPKAEIMKQIEKSVIKYMKELEAEGKIVKTTETEEPEPYFKVVTMKGTETKRNTAKPAKRIASSTVNQHDPHRVSANRKYQQNSAAPAETENSYQGPAQEVAADLTPNVEFTYKIKTKAPLHTATVKTVSKPYNLALKSYDHFDHSAALKNLQEFDLTHVVTTPDPEAHKVNTANSKPKKLYFNSEIYHDINSVPLKQKQRTEVEYQPDYESYAASKSQGGYYAEPPADREPASSPVNEDGYPLMNPYQYVSKKEALAAKYDESGNTQEQQQQQTRTHKYNPLEYDSYNPKFNNNPEGYGYQQTYKTHLPNRHGAGKRGKRGGSTHSNNNKKSTHRVNFKDYEANVALRPPPKN